MRKPRVVTVRCVRQKCEDDCGVASLAMATGRSYEHIRKIVLRRGNVVREGRSLLTRHKDITRILKLKDFSCRRKIFSKWAALDRMSLVSVNRDSNRTYHWVVYSRGVIWDPYPTHRCRRREVRGLKPTGQYIQVDCNVE
jgi:hypothetical protein